MLVADVMTPDPVSVREDKRLLAAKAIMEFSRIRHLPVVNAHGDLVGLLTRGTLLAASASLLDHIPAVESDHQLGAVLIRDVMVHGPMTVEAGAHVSTAAHLMATRKVGCLPVVEGSRLVGIITEVDLLRLVEQAEKHHLLDTLGASAHPHP